MDSSSPRSRAFISMKVCSLIKSQHTLLLPAKEDYVVDMEHIQPKSLLEDPHTNALTTTKNEYDIFPNVYPIIAA
jgi:hypothetical protein